MWEKGGRRVTIAQQLFVRCVCTPVLTLFAFLNCILVVFKGHTTRTPQSETFMYLTETFWSSLLCKYSDAAFWSLLVPDERSGAGRFFTHGSFVRALSLALITSGQSISLRVIKPILTHPLRVSNASKVPDPALRLNHDIVKLGKPNLKDFDDALELPVGITLAFSPVFDSYPMIGLDRHQCLSTDRAQKAVRC